MSRLLALIELFLLTACVLCLVCGTWASQALPSLGERPQHRVGIRFEPERPARVGALLRLVLSSSGLKLA